METATSKYRSKTGFILSSWTTEAQTYSCTRELANLLSFPTKRSIFQLNNITLNKTIEQQNGFPIWQSTKDSARQNFPYKKKKNHYYHQNISKLRRPIAKIVPGYYLPNDRFKKNWKYKRIRFDNVSFFREDVG